MELVGLSVRVLCARIRAVQLNTLPGLLPSCLEPRPPKQSSKPKLRRACVGTQRLHVAIWYILRAQRCSHITTLGSKYIPYSYMEPFGHPKTEL